MNAAHTSGVFVFEPSKIFRFFLALRRDEKLGTQMGQIHAIRSYRMTPRRGRKMLRRIIDHRCAASRLGIEATFKVNHARQ
jgi:hypothetical protein